MKSTLVLAASYEPISVTSWREAVRLLTLNKCEVIEEYEEELRSKYLIIRMPAVIRLLSMFRRKPKKMRFSRIGIYARDKFKCQYCGKKGKFKDFTFDHVIPKSRGGRTNWQNIVTCCHKCNRRKGDKTPKEANMVLINKPEQPTWLPIIAIKLQHRVKDLPSQWASYIYWYGELDQD